MVSVLALSAVDRGFEPHRVKPKTKLVFVASPLSTQSKDLLTRNQINVSEWGDMSIRGGRTVVSVSSVAL